jgi:hypothetical protein
MICMLLTGRTVRVSPLKGTRYGTYLTHSIPIPLTRLNRTRLMRDRQLSGRCVARALSLRMRTVWLRREPTRWGSEMPAESSTTHAAAGPDVTIFARQEGHIRSSATIDRRKWHMLPSFYRTWIIISNSFYSKLDLFYI